MPNSNTKEDAYIKDAVAKLSEARATAVLINFKLDQATQRVQSLCQSKATIESEIRELEITVENLQRQQDKPMAFIDRWARRFGF